MIQLYEKADTLRKEADEAQEKFIENKVKADDEHKKHIENIRQVHDYDKIITGLRQKARKARKKKDESLRHEGGGRDLRQVQEGREAQHRRPDGPSEVRLPISRNLHRPALIFFLSIISVQPHFFIVS